MKKFDISKFLGFLQSYSDKKEYLTPSFRRESIVIADVPIEDKEHKELTIELLFGGSRKEIKNELVDDLLVQADTSYNPSRPFRWYKFTDGDCADTNDEKSINDVRNKSLDYVLAQIGTPEKFYIYKITIK